MIQFLVHLMNNKKEMSAMKGFRNYLLEKSGLDKLKIPSSLGLDDKEFNGQYLPLGKETKKISSSLAKLITSIFFHWNEMGNISHLKRSISVAIALSDTDHKEPDVLNIMEPISKDGLYPPKLFVPPLVLEWFQKMMKTRKRLMDQLSDDELDGATQPTIFNLIWIISKGQGGDEWNDPTKKKERK